MRIPHAAGAAIRVVQLGSSDGERGVRLPCNRLVTLLDDVWIALRNGYRVQPEDAGVKPCPCMSRLQPGNEIVIKPMHQKV